MPGWPVPGAGGTLQQSCAEVRCAAPQQRHTCLLAPGLVDAAAKPEHAQDAGQMLMAIAADAALAHFRLLMGRRMAADTGADAAVPGRVGAAQGD
jgi:hypothetical protein